MLDLVQPERQLRLDGMLRKLVSNRPKERYLVLFNDLLLICKPQMLTKDKYQFSRAIRVARLLVNPHVDPRTPRWSLPRGVGCLTLREEAHGRASASARNGLGRREQARRTLTQSSTSTPSAWSRCLTKRPSLVRARLARPVRRCKGPCERPRHLRTRRLAMHAVGAGRGDWAYRRIPACASEEERDQWIKNLTAVSEELRDRGTEHILGRCSPQLPRRTRS